MTAAIIALLIASFVAVKVKANYRFPAFLIAILLFLPVAAYVVAGTGMVLAGLSGSDIVGDFFSIAQQCYTEPFLLFRPAVEGMRPLNPSFAMAGTLVILSTVVSFVQVTVWILSQRDKNGKKGAGFLAG